MLSTPSGIPNLFQYRRRVAEMFHSRTYGQLSVSRLSILRNRASRFSRSNSTSACSIRLSISALLNPVRLLELFSSASEECHDVRGLGKIVPPQEAHVMSNECSSMSRIHPAKSVFFTPISMPHFFSSALNGSRNLLSPGERDRKVKRNSRFSPPISFSRIPVSALRFQPASARSLRACAGS